MPSLRNRLAESKISQNGELMSINWFPGHMNTAKREIAQAMGKVRIVIEVLDARIPSSSENPVIGALRGNTPHIKVLNKRDLADPAVTRAWLSHLNGQPGLTAVALHRNEPAEIRALIQLGRSLLPDSRSNNAQTTAMVLGIPNCGKSTLINTLVGRKVATTSNRPAVTRKQQRIRFSDDFWLLDTPGMLWPKLSPPECGYRLAVTGAIRDGVLDFEDIACFAARYLIDTYPDALAKRYSLVDIPSDEMELLQIIGRRRGCVGRGGIINIEKASELLIQDIRHGALDQISFERPSVGT